MTAFLGNILGSLLKFIYDAISSTGLESSYISYYSMAIILTTIVFKLALLPLNLKQSKNMRKTSALQPQIAEIQAKYKNDPQTMQTKVQAFYKENNYNPASGCLPLLIQLPIMIAFFAVFRDPAKYAFTDPGLYESINKSFLWIANLDVPDPYLIGMPFLSAITTYLQTKTIGTPVAADAKTQQTQNTMNYMMPVVIFLSARSFQAGLALYWVTSNIFTSIQQLISKRTLLSNKEEK